jgi:hypothetical protein
MAGCGSRLLVSIYFFSPHYISNISSTPYHDMRRRPRAAELASTSSRLTSHAPFSIQERPAASEGRSMCVTQTAPGQSIHSSTPPTHGGSPIDANLPAPVRFPVAPFSRMLGEICLWPRGLVVCWSGGPVAPRAVNQPY